MVTVDEGFLPYMLAGKQILNQALSNGYLKMLPGADLEMLSSADIGHQAHPAPAGVLPEVDLLGFLKAER